MDEVSIMVRIDKNRQSMRTAMSLLSAANEEHTNIEKQARHMHLDLIEAIKMHRAARRMKKTNERVVSKCADITAGWLVASSSRRQSQ